MHDANNPYAPAAPETVVTETATPADATVALHEEAEKLLKQGKSGANWFYWIAGLSLINSLIFLSGGETFFVCGMGVTAIVDAIAGEIAKEVPEGAAMIRGIAFVFSLGVMAMVVGCGWLSGRGYLWPFGIGIALYAMDALIFLLIGDMMSFGFHAFALWCMISGWRAFWKYQAFVRAWQEEELEEPAVAVG